MRSTNRYIVTAAGAAAALVLLTTGCSSADESAASGQNADACTSFAAAHNDLVGLVKTGPGTAENLDPWTASKKAAVEKIAALPATASGDAASAITTFVEALPADTLELSEPDSASGKAFVDNGAAVKSACEADGTSITLDELPLTTFTN